MQSLGRLVQRSCRSAAPMRYFSSSVSGVFPYRSVCKATIVGRTGSLPDFYEFESGGSSLTFSVATSQIRVIDGARDEEEITQWNRVKVYHNYPGYDGFLKDLSPGTLVYAEGALRIQKSGDTYYTSVDVKRGNGTFTVLKSSPRDEEIER